MGGQHKGFHGQEPRSVSEAILVVDGIAEIPGAVDKALLDRQVFHRVTPPVSKSSGKGLLDIGRPFLSMELGGITDNFCSRWRCRKNRCNAADFP